MRLMRAVVIVAIVAALSGAPPSVSAAANQLDSPQVTPGSGSVTTVFTLRVRYDGAFAATSVSVSVASLSLPMVLESGTLTAGWWTVATLLPVGAWSTTFSSTAARGPSATVAGPVVVVAAPATAPPTIITSPTPPDPGGPTPDAAPVPDSGDGTAASAAPDTAPDEAPDASAPTSAPGAAPATPNSTAAGDGTTGAPSGGTGTAPDAGGGGGGDADEPAEGAPAASAADTPGPGGAEAPVRPDSDPPSDGKTASSNDLVSTVILVGLAGVASVAILGTMLLLAGRRRDPEQAAASPAGPATPTAPPTPTPRRTPRRPADDPIVAALGVDDEMAARRAIRRARSARVADDAPAVRPRRR